MGAWGVHPMQNDAAWDWVGDHVEHHLLDVIEKTLTAFLDGSDDEIEEPEAEACAALLVDFTSSATKWRYHTVDIRYLSKERGLWDLAIKVVEKLLADEWWRGWTNEQQKLDALEELRAELESVKEETKDMEVQN